MQNRRRDTDVQYRLLDSVGEGEGGMFWKNSMYIIYSETDHQPRMDAWDKCSGLVHWEDPEESYILEIKPFRLHCLQTFLITFLRKLTWGVIIPYSGAGARPSENLSFGSQCFYLLNTLSALPLPSSLIWVFGVLTQSFFISPKRNQYSYHTTLSHFGISFLYTTQFD